jgi:5-methylcytosine-specific restriction enzyme subunit McrC
VDSPSDRPTLVLAEYGEGEVDLDASQERRLRRLVGNRLTILPSDGPNRWRVKASSYIGTVVTPDVQILVVPKVPTANLFHLLEASGRTVGLGAEAFDYERTHSLVPSFATFYARHLEAAVGRGVCRDYRACEERLPNVRGKVNLAAQRRLSGLPLPVECRFDDYTADTPLNRILRGAVIRLLRLPGVTVTTRQALQQLSSRLEEAGDVTTGDLRSATLFTRLNSHCRPAERLARIVLSESSILDAVGAAGAAVFMVDMNKVFEEFVEARLRRYLASRLDVHGQHPARLDVAGSVRIRPDLVFETPAGTITYVADSKYKVTADGFGRETDYYQLLAYTSALGLHEGTLIYCQHDGNVPSQQIEVRHVGNRLRTWALRLDRTPTDIEAEMRILADYIVDRASAASLHAVGHDDRAVSPMGVT